MDSLPGLCTVDAPGIPNPDTLQEDLLADHLGLLDQEVDLLHNYWEISVLCLAITSSM